MSQERTGRFMDGNRLLINGPLQLTTADIIKLGTMLVIGVAAVITLSNKVDNMSTTLNQRIESLEVGHSQRQVYVERLIGLERDVTAVNERAHSAIVGESRLLNERLSAIERRLSSIENRLVVSLKANPSSDR